MGHARKSYPDVFYTTYREFLLLQRGHVEDRTFLAAQVRRLIYYDILGNSNIKSQNKPKRETDLYMLAGDVRTNRKTVSKMSRKWAELFRASGMRVADRNICDI